MAMSEENIRKRDFSIYNDLKGEYESQGHKDKHESITDFIYPQGAKYDDDDVSNSGDRKDDEILNNTATLAHRALTAGVFGGVIDPTSEWIKLSSADRRLQDNAAAQEWYKTHTELVLDTLSNSNFYTQGVRVFAGMIAYGTSAVQIDEDEKEIVRFTPFENGQYYIDTDDRGRVNWICREFTMRARNVIERFGEDKVSQSVRDKVVPPKTGSDWIKILHVQTRNTDRDSDMIDSKNKPWRSTYYELDKKDHTALRESGYDEQPFAAPRWDMGSGDRWGYGPGELAIGDVMELQKLEEERLVAVAKANDPPLIANAKVGAIAVNTGPSGITWADGVTMGQEPILTPAQSITADIGALDNSIALVEERIKQAFLAHLFFAQGESDPRETATLTVHKEREKLRILGPILERLFPEFIKIVVDRVFDVLVKRGLVTPAPLEIQGTDLKVEIISLIKQAQRLTIIGPIEQYLGIAAATAQTWPEALKKVDAQQAMDVIGRALSVDPSIIVPDEVVRQIEEDEAAAIAQQQAIEQSHQAIAGAKQLSETDLSGDNALNAALGAA
jgi:hypothetical protein